MTPYRTAPTVPYTPLRLRTVLFRALVGVATVAAAYGLTLAAERAAVQLLADRRPTPCPEKTP